MKAIPWWAVAAASAAPAVLIGGFLVATAMQPASYNPVRDTISELCERGATDAWVMTSALAGLGLCYLLVARRNAARGTCCPPPPGRRRCGDAIDRRVS